MTAEQVDQVGIRLEDVPEPSETDRMLREQAIDLTADIVVPDDENATDDEAEEFAGKIIKRAASLQGVKIDRAMFLRTEVRKRCPDIDLDEVVATTPAAAGVPADVIDEIAKAVIDFETKKCAGLSFLSGIPGGPALFAMVPADLAQYFAHVMRVEQKLAYVYGWQTFLDDDDEVDDETLMELIVLMGVMMGVGGAAGSVTKFAATVAQQGVVKTVQRKALTKTTFYPVMKSVLRVLGVNLTKQTFAKTVGKVVPIIGGVVSGGLTYVSFKPGAEHLRQHLRSLPVSGVSDVPEAEADGRLKAAAESVQAGASVVAGRAAFIGSTLAAGAQTTGSAVAGKASEAGRRFGSLLKSRSEADQHDS